MNEREWFELIREFVKAAPKMVPEAQVAVAGYIGYMSRPIVRLKAVEENTPHGD